MKIQKSISEIKNGIEALLFISPRAVPLKKIEKLFPEAEKDVIQIIISDLIIEYRNKNSAIRIVQSNEEVEMLLKPEYKEYNLFAVGKKLTKSELKTLALISLNSPIEQYKITKKRPNEHLLTLKELGLIQVTKKGRRNVLETTKKFDLLYNKKNKN